MKEALKVIFYTLKSNIIVAIFNYSLLKCFIMVTIADSFTIIKLNAAVKSRSVTIMTKFSQKIHL